MPAAKSVKELQKLTAAEPKNAAAWQQLGNALLDEGKFDRGISAFRRALRIDDGLAEVHNDLGAAYFEKRWYAEAEACFRKAIAAEPAHGVAYANLGAALRAQGRLADGRRAFQRALLLKLRRLLPPLLRWRVAATAAAPAAPAPGAPGEELKAIAAAVKAGQPQRALELARALRQRYPEDPDALHLHGAALEENRDYAAALESMRAAIARKPDRYEYHMSLARILVHEGRQSDALEAAAQAARLEPGSAIALASLAAVYGHWRDDLALEVAQRAVEIDAACDVAQGNLANALWALGRLEEAEGHAREAVRLSPQQLSFRANLALILKDLGRMDEARQLYHALSEEAPDYPKLCMDMGTLAIECEGDLAGARRWYGKAQASGDPRAFLSEAVADLLEGKFESGWQRYEARKKTREQIPQQAPFAAFAAWQGERLESGRLLLYAEQGLGDEIMFASMFGELAPRAADGVVLLCDARLGALFARSFPSFEVIAQRRDNFQAQVPRPEGIACAISAASLGQHLRRRAGDFPAHRGYLVAAPQKLAANRERLAALGPGLKVGLSWTGGLQRTGRSRRSLALADLQPVLALPGVQWVSLQHPDATTELAAFRERSGIRIHEFPGVTRDMDELAALIAALDLVVSVCNTTVHVAGALGKDVLVMAPFVPEWRYGLRGERMIWYPSAHVLRQARYGDWSQVLESVGAELRRRAVA